MPILYRNARAVSFVGREITIVLSGDYEAEQTLTTNGEGTVVFENVPIGSSIRGIAYISTMNDEYSEDWQYGYAGASDIFMVVDGENNVIIPMTKTSDLEYRVSVLPNPITRNDSTITVKAVGGIADRPELGGVYFWTILVCKDAAPESGNIYDSVGQYSYTTTSPVLNIPLSTSLDTDLWVEGEVYTFQIYSNWHTNITSGTGFPINRISENNYFIENIVHW